MTNKEWIHYWQNFFFACNIPFSVTEHPSFIEFASALRPGYKPPTRKVLSSTVLDSVTDELQTDMKSKLDGKECTFILEDGCSNCHNDPVTASCVHADKQAYFMDAKATGATSKTGENLKEMCKETISKACDTYRCTVKNIVTDNAKNMDKMRKLLLEEDSDLLVYGCNAHWLILLGQDITPSSVVKHIADVHKYFKNHHQPSAWLGECSGSVKPQIPGDTRWNSQLTCMDTYLQNRGFMINITQEHADYFDVNTVLCMVSPMFLLDLYFSRTTVTNKSRCFAGHLPEPLCYFSLKCI